MVDIEKGSVPTKRRNSPGTLLVEICILAMMGAIMTVSDLLMNVIPNVHLVGVMIVTLTAVYRWKALYSIYVYVLMIGLFEGFGLWWFPYLYVWTVLWGLTMLLPPPTRMPKWLAPIAYGFVCALHGFAFGFLWIPSQMLLMNFSWKMALSWWAVGFVTADIPHGIGNLVGSTLIVPLITLIRKLDRRLST